MTTRRVWSGTILAIALSAAMALVANAALASAATTKVVYSFAGDEDGEYPSTDLVLDQAGNLYGTTVLGGDFGSGTVFEVSPTGVHTVLHSFTSGTDGGQPYGGVTLDPHGNLYGTAVTGGSGGTCPEDGCGVAYELTNSGGTWTETVIHNFAGGNDGYGPGAGLTLHDGSLYGMTPTGGAYGLGVIYQLKRDHSGAWRERIVHTFTGGDDGGAGSAGRLLADRSGNLFGVATVGGANGAGTAFELTPGQNGQWTFTTLYAFKGQPDAGFPYGALTFDHSGNLFGTSYYDGANDLGAVYELRLRNGVWHETVLYSFKGGTDGSGPISNVDVDQSGNLYGTTSEGGAVGCGCGTIFELAPGSHGTWTESIIHAFTGAPDGNSPYNGMVADRSGNYFGATVHGGSADEGAVYEFTP